MDTIIIIIIITIIIIIIIIILLLKSTWVAWLCNQSFWSDRSAVRFAFNVRMSKHNGSM